MKRVLFIVSEDWYFVSHRLHLAVAAIDKGISVSLLTKVSKYRNLIESYGIEVIEWSLNRGRINVVADVKAVLEILHLVKKFNPDVIHAVALKPVIYSSLVSMVTGVKMRVFALGGLGFNFSSNAMLARFTRPILIYVLRLVLKSIHTRLILQNPDDKELFLRYRIIDDDRVRLIRGSGVDTEKYYPKKNEKDPTLVILPARMLWDKGINEFVECAQRFKNDGISVRFCLVGGIDKYNPERIPVVKLEEWVSEGAVEWWGQRDDMPNIYSKSALVCFPSYREGLPMALLEAASCGVPIVAYNVPGCREIVKDQVNGYLVPLKDLDALYYSVLRLLNDPGLCERMGNSGREIVLREFSQEIIAAQTMDVWKEVA